MQSPDPKFRNITITHSCGHPQEHYVDIDAVEKAVMEMEPCDDCFMDGHDTHPSKEELDH